MGILRRPIRRMQASSSYEDHQKQKYPQCIHEVPIDGCNFKRRLFHSEGRPSESENSAQNMKAVQTGKDVIERCLPSGVQIEAFVCQLEEDANLSGEESQTEQKCRKQP